MEYEIPSHPAKRQRLHKLPYRHKHRLQHRPQYPAHVEPALVPSKLADKLVVDSIKTICEEQAWRQNIQDPVVESVALEALRNAAEEYALNICEKVRRSMIAARRTIPIATDFESAFYSLDVPRLDDQLLRYRHQKQDGEDGEPALQRGPTLLPTPPPDDEFHPAHELPESVLGPQLSHQRDLKQYCFNLSSLPHLPSAHTYKHTDVYSEREVDSRRIRELATEEGKLGEQALRKLAGAVKVESALSTDPEARFVRAKGRPWQRHLALTEEAAFEETMRDLLAHEKGDFELGPVVSSEKAYRMPDEVRAKRRHVPSATNRLSSTSGASFSGPTDPGGKSKYNLLPPPISRSKPSGSSAVASSSRPDPMDLGFDL